MPRKTTVVSSLQGPKCNAILLACWFFYTLTVLDHSHALDYKIVVEESMCLGFEQLQEQEHLPKALPTRQEHLQEQAHLPEAQPLEQEHLPKAQPLAPLLKPEVPAATPALQGPVPPGAEIVSMTNMERSM
eukprot:2700930-Amphidinium_carterae.2